jgi:hypothetical protein
MKTAHFTRWLAAILCFCCLAAQAEEVPILARQIRIMVTVDWEGWSLEDENLEAMRQFRQKYPHIPMVQFLNPVYAIKFADTSPKIMSTLQQGDVHGLHIHAWKTLVEACQIPYQSSPAFDDDAKHCQIGLCGYSVSLEHAYEEEALTKLVTCSANMLVEQGFERPVTFRAGGWQLGPKLARALKTNGFTMDSSRMSATHLHERWGKDSRMVAMVSQLHPDAHVLESPYELLPGLMEYPNNASLADYTRTGQFVGMFRQLLGQKDPLMVLGFHQETAVDYLQRLEDAILQMEAIAKQNAIDILWVAHP